MILFHFKTCAPVSIGYRGAGQRIANLRDDIHLSLEAGVPLYVRGSGPSAARIRDCRTTAVTI